MSVVFSASALRPVHDVTVTSKKKRSFVIDISDVGGNTYESTITVLDRVSETPGSWLCQVQSSSPSKNDNYQGAIELIKRYLDSVDQTDAISDVYNPCNCPFVTEADQNRILNQMGVPITVRVN